MTGARPIIGMRLFCASGMKNRMMKKLLKRPAKKAVEKSGQITGVKGQ